MAEDWNPGDLAICIKQGRWTPVGHDGHDKGPVFGIIYQVITYEPETPARHCCGHGYLELVGFDGMMWCAGAFRKVRPDTEPATDAETIALIKGAGLKVPA